MRITQLTAGGQHTSWYRSLIEGVIKELIDAGVTISGSGSEGGYFSISRTGTENPHTEYHIACGTFPKEKEPAYFYFSIEKAFRLNANFIAHGHITSRQSANDDTEEYAGGIYAEREKRLFTFSGLKAWLDELLSAFGSCIRAYLNQSDYPEIIEFADIPELFKSRIRLLDSTPEQKMAVINAVEKVIAREIQKKKK